MFRNLRKKEDKCIFCSSGNVYRYFLCRDCFENLSRINKTGYQFRYLDEIYICYKYASLMKEMLRDFKYNEKTYLYKVFGEMIIETVFDNGLNRQYDMLTYIPMSRTSENKRGYNQAQLMAEYVSDNTLIKCENLLIKNYNNKKQEHLSSVKRYENVKDAFSAESSAEGKDIIIIDDIVTTGYTIDFAAEALKKKGAKKVAAVITATGDSL